MSQQSNEKAGYRMVYEEKTICGALMYRHHPDEEWRTCSSHKVNFRLNEALSTIKALREKEAKKNSAIDSIRFYINLALFFGFGLIWIVLDVSSGKTTDLTHIMICSFFIVWNINHCGKAKGGENDG